MTDTEIVKQWAEEGIGEIPPQRYLVTGEELADLCARVRADERERAAKVADEHFVESYKLLVNPPTPRFIYSGDIAAAIRSEK
jgi:hypothetical protein